MNAKYYKAICFLRQCAVMKRRFTLPITLVKTKFWKSESYFPELPNHKSRFRIFCELLGHIMRYGSIEWYYFAYGFDVKGFRKQKEYMDESQFIWNVYMLDAVMPSYDYTCILRDKTLFSTLLPVYGVKCPRIVLDTRFCSVQHAVNQLFAEISGGGVFL